MVQGVNSDWQKAQNLISQQTQILVNELWNLQQGRTVLDSRLKETEAALKEYMDKPHTNSVGWYEKRLSDEAKRRFQAETETRQCKEFMRLKDQSKIKVELQRDAYSRNLELANAKVLDLEKKLFESAELRAQNARQAKEFLELGRKVQSMNKRAQLAEEKVRNLQDILNLGRKAWVEEWKKSEGW